MKANMGVLGVMLAGVMMLGGCGGGDTAALFNAQQTDLGPACGSLRATRADNTVIVEISLANLPQAADMVAVGLKLPDGTVVYPNAIRVLEAPSGALAGYPADGQNALLRVQVVYQLDEGATAADGSVFSLALGDVDSTAGREMGITTGVSTRNGSPFLADHTIPWPAVANADNVPVPPAPRSTVPAVRYRLRTPMAADGSVIALTPVDGPVSSVPAGLVALAD
jgi:hypothetical protein